MDYLSDSYPTGAFLHPPTTRRSSDAEKEKGAKMTPAGIYTKFASNGSTSGLQESRLLRLNRFCLQEISASLLPRERVSFCMRRRISKDAGVKVLFNPVREKGALWQFDNLW